MSLARAIETGDLTQLPSRRDEGWRWSDLRGLVRVLPPRSPKGTAPRRPAPFAGIEAERVDIVNGEGPALVTVAEGQSKVVALRFIADAHAGSHAARLSIEVAANARLVLLESYEGEGEDYVADAELSIAVGQGAALERIVVADDADSAVAVCVAEVALQAGAVFCQSILTTGARRQRIETRVAHPGGGASARLDGVYLLGARRHGDITTIVKHAGPGGRTDQLVKGVARDQARGVFQGLIAVSPGADQTTARMGHHALVLSDRAEVDAKPELEIEADDVSCAHGNTVGGLDADALFYAAQRGVPEGEARAMLTRAFVEAVVDRIEHEGAREVARGWIAASLEAAP